MCLFDLVEQYDLIRPAADGLCQRTAFFISNISGRRPDQPGHGVLLHEFRHIDTNHGVFVIEEERRQCLCQLRLADACRSEEHERSDRTVRVLQTSSGPAHCRRHGSDRLLLANDTSGQRIFHAQKFFTLAFQHLVDRNAGPARYHLRNVIARHGLLDHAFSALLLLRFRKLFLKLRNTAIGELAGPREIAGPLRLLKLMARRVQLLFQVLRFIELFLFLVPPAGQGIGLLFQIRQFLFQRLQAILRGAVVFLLQGFALDLHLDDPAIEFIQLFRLGIDLHTQPACGFVHQIDRLIGQEPVRDVTVG